MSPSFICVLYPMVSVTLPRICSVLTPAQASLSGFPEHPRPPAPTFDSLCGLQEPAGWNFDTRFLLKGLHGAAPRLPAWPCASCRQGDCAARHPLRPRPQAAAAASIATSAPRGGAHPPINLGGDSLSLDFFIRTRPRAPRAAPQARSQTRRMPGSDS